MPSQNQSREPEPSETTQLSEEVSQLRGELRMLRDSIDEFREVFEWAAQNGRLTPGPTEMDELQFPTQSRGTVSAVESNFADSEPVERLNPQPLPLENEAAQYDLGRLNYLLRIIPKPEGFDQTKYYFYNFRLFYDAHKQEIPYLFTQTQDGLLGEEAKSNFSKFIDQEHLKLVKFEKTSEAFWIDR